MAESHSQRESSQRPQYHHFVPRFLLKNFAGFKNPGHIVPKTSTKAKNRAPRPQKLTILDLKSGAFNQGSVDETFGIVDLYRDFKQADHDQQKLEKELSVLESAAGRIFAQVKKVFDAGKSEVQLIRKDKDILRRFLFIMMYRNSSFAKRFEKSREDYDADDRAEMLAYMDEKGFQTPKDVWFANIRAFLEIKLDEDWPDALEELTRRAYPMDAQWFFNHIQAFFIAFCTPKNTEDEYVLTQNSYSIYEGPTSAGPWTDYHRFAPVSPKIMIVLRSLLLPCAGLKEDMETQRMLLEVTKSMHLDPDKAGSYLEDLPVSRARNNYSKVVNGQVEPLPTKMSRDKHVFYFPFFPLNHEHVQKINMICLENAYDTLAVVYKSRESLRTALEFYLTDKRPGFKVIRGDRPSIPKSLQEMLQGVGQISDVWKEDKLLPYLQLLHKFARELGSTVKLEYNVVDGLGGAKELQKNISDDLGSIVIPEMIAEFSPGYGKLGGTFESVHRDYDQARRIVQLIIKVDTLIKTCDPEVRYAVRQNREDLIATLPPRRVWLSIKHLRSLQHVKTKNQKMSFQNKKDKEDAIVDANRLFKADSLARIMYKVFFIDHFLTQQPNFGLVDAFTLDERGAKHLHQELELVFNKPGSIRNCGIAAIEQLAQWLATQPRPSRQAMEQIFPYRVLSDEQMLERWMRMGIKEAFDELLDAELGDEERAALKDVFFRHLYWPELGGRMRE